MIDNKEMNRILSKLEDCEDEEKAVMYLKKFNSQSKILGKLLLNLDKSLAHDEWKRQCDQAQKELDRIVAEIEAL